MHTITEKGLQEIRSELDSCHSMDISEFTDSNILAWAADVERNLDENGDAYFEISQHATLSGHTEICSLSDDAWEFIKDDE